MPFKCWVVCQIQGGWLSLQPARLCGLTFSRRGALYASVDSPVLVTRVNASDSTSTHTIAAWGVPNIVELVIKGVIEGLQTADAKKGSAQHTVFGAAFSLGTTLYVLLIPGDLFWCALHPAGRAIHHSHPSQNIAKFDEYPNPHSLCEKTKPTWAQ